MLLLFLTSAPRAAWADGRRDLDDGIAFYNALDTERAEARLEAASRAWDLSASERATAFLYLGMLAFELGRLREADAAWQAALTLDGEQRPPSTSSPKIREAFERVRKALPDPPPAPPPQDLPPQSAAPPPIIPSVERAPAVDAAPGSESGPGEPRLEAETKVPPPPKLVPPPAVPPPETPPGLDLSQPPLDGDEDDDGVSPWLWVGLGGAALAATAAVLAVVLGGSDDGSECARGGGGCVSVQLQ